MAEYEKKVRKILAENGCRFVRHGRGDHDIWYSPITDRNLTVDGKIDKRHTANGVLKQAGVDCHL
jgi:predicted RNA binding protein YcfA (HicA-like mRNA interferase family)